MGLMKIHSWVKGRDDVIAFELKKGCIPGSSLLRPQVINVRKTCYKVPVYAFP